MGYRRIGEFCRLVGVSAETVRRWEREGYLHPKRTIGGHRLFSDADVALALKSTVKERDDNEKA